MLNELHKTQSRENYSAIDIFKYPFENMVPFQTGKYTVWANILDPRTGESIGGGLVAEFTNLNDANICFDEIVAINPRYEPTISRENWKLDLSEEVRSPKETVHQARENAKRAFEKDREIQTQHEASAA